MVILFVLGVVPAGFLEAGKLPDLTVVELGLDPDGYVLCKLGNIGGGMIPDSEFLNSTLRVNVNAQSYDFRMAALEQDAFQGPPVDPRGQLKKPNGTVIFNTGIKLDTTAMVSVIVDFGNQIREENENNNRLGRELEWKPGMSAEPGTLYIQFKNSGFCSLSHTRQSFKAIGGTDSIDVTTTWGYHWTAKSNADWITITTKDGGFGDGTVTYAVKANLGTATRTGTITIAGIAFAVIQTGDYSTYTISPTAKSFSAAGGDGNVKVTTLDGFGWTATSNVDWIVITAGKLGTGSGMVFYSLAENPSGMPRVGTLTIAGKIFTVDQARMEEEFMQEMK